MERKVGQWQIGETLGKGGYSWVKKGYNNTTSSVVALKFMSRADASWAHEQARQVQTEIEALSAVNHKYVLNLLDYDLKAKYPRKNAKDIDVILLVLEYAPGGELFDILYYTEALEEQVARTYFNQLVQGLEACHKAGVCHRDVKPQNLLLNHRFQLKITDFGLSKIFETDADSVMKTMYVGTRGYQAPELLVNRPYTVAADVFSAAVVLFILLTGYPPFEQAQKSDKWYKPLVDGKPDVFWRQHANCGVSKQAQDMLTKMMAFDPQKRLTVDQIKQHPWYTAQILQPDELYRALRLQHRKAEIRRKADPKKMSDLRDSIKTTARPIPYKIEELATQAPPVPDDLHRTLTQFLTKKHGYEILNLLEKYFKQIAQANVTFDKAAFLMSATVRVSVGGEARELGIQVRVYKDETNNANLVCFKRLQGDFINYRKFFRLVIDFVGPDITRCVEN